MITLEGSSVAEIRKEFEFSIDDYLRACETRGRTPDKAYSGKIPLGSLQMSTEPLKRPPRLGRRASTLGSPKRSSGRSAVSSGSQKIIEGVLDRRCAGTHRPCGQEDCIGASFESGPIRQAPSCARWPTVRTTEDIQAIENRYQEKSQHRGEELRAGRGDMGKQPVVASRTGSQMMSLPFTWLGSARRLHRP